MCAYRRTQIDSYLSSCTKLQSKWIKDLNIKPDIQNLRVEKVGNSLEYVGTGDGFLNGTPLTEALKSTINNGTL